MTKCTGGFSPHREGRYRPLRQQREFEIKQAWLRRAQKEKDRVDPRSKGDATFLAKLLRNSHLNMYLKVCYKFLGTVQIAICGQHRILELLPFK